MNENDDKLFKLRFQKPGKMRSARDYRQVQQLEAPLQLRRRAERQRRAGVPLLLRYAADGAKEVFPGSRENGSVPVQLQSDV